MPVCGYYFGRIFSGLVRDIAEYISFLLLFLLGGRMLYEAITAPEAGLMLMERETILLHGVATSIDALLVGVALALSGAGIIRAALVIAAVTTVLSFASVYVGGACGRVLEDKARALGGIILLISQRGFSPGVSDKNKKTVRKTGRLFIHRRKNDTKCLLSWNVSSGLSGSVPVYIITYRRFRYHTFALKKTVA